MPPVRGSEFGLALCKHLGLAPEKVSHSVKVNSGGDQLFSVTMDITLTADDLAGIAAHMGAEKRKVCFCGNVHVDSRCDRDVIKQEIAKAVEALQRSGRI